MATTFDLYVLRRYLSTFLMMFVSTFGLFVVIDVFTNVDSFQGGGQGAADVLLHMLGYYTYQSSMFLDLVGSILAVVTVMIVLAVLQRHSEITPLLAAGVPTYRLAVPAMIGMLLVTAGVIANRELVIPRIALNIQGPRGAAGHKPRRIEPMYDSASRIWIGGKRLYPASLQISKARFVLPAPAIASELTTLRAEKALFVAETQSHSAGWILHDPAPAFGQIHLTAAGRKLVAPVADSPDIFVATNVSFDQLYNRTQSYKFLPTRELIRRISQPAVSTLISVRRQKLELHSRLVQPLSNIIAVLIVIPLLIRRESHSLVTNMAICTALLGVMMGLVELCNYLGGVNLIATDLAAWVPLIFCGSTAVWLVGVVQT